MVHKAISSAHHSVVAPSGIHQERRHSVHARLRWDRNRIDGWFVRTTVPDDGYDDRRTVEIDLLRSPAPFFKWCIEEDLAREHPVRCVKFFQADTRRLRDLTQAEFSRVLQHDHQVAIP